MLLRDPSHLRESEVNKLWQFWSDRQERGLVAFRFGATAWKDARQPPKRKDKQPTTASHEQDLSATDKQADNVNPVAEQHQTQSQAPNNNPPSTPELVNGSPATEVQAVNSTQVTEDPASRQKGSVDPASAQERSEDPASRQEGTGDPALRQGGAEDINQSDDRNVLQKKAASRSLRKRSSPDAESSRYGILLL